MDKLSCIYKIGNAVTGDFYIGSTTNWAARSTIHKGLLRVNKHGNPKLQASYNKHGVEAFVYSVVEEVPDIQCLYLREQFYIDTLNPAYNITRDANVPKRGHVVTEETRQKLRESYQRYRESPEYAAFVKRRSAEVTGTKKGPPSEETRRKIGEAHKGNTWTLGRVQSPQEREKRSLIAKERAKADPSRLRGLKPPSPEGVKKLQDGFALYVQEHGHPMKGRKMSAETIEKIRQHHLADPPMKGRKASPETRAKQSASIKAAWARRKAETANATRTGQS